jgi:hypothetical protein
MGVNEVNEDAAAAGGAGVGLGTGAAVWGFSVAVGGVLAM